MSLEKKIQELGLELPPPAAPVGSYLSAVRTGNLIYTSGQIPVKDGKPMFTGKVPSQVTLEQAQSAARQCVLNALATIKSMVGLESIARVVRINVFVNSAVGFTDQAKVANGASDLLVAIFGDAGKHTRCAIGAAELPLNVPVEVDLIVEVKQ